MNNAYINKCKKANLEPKSLDEWFKLFRELYPKDTDCQLLSRIRIGMSQCACNSFLQKQDIYTLFLMSYMLLKHNKRWDNKEGGKWI